MSSRDQSSGGRLTTLLVSAVASIVPLLRPAEPLAQPAFPPVPDSEITADGLYPLDPSVLGVVAWLRPDVDLSDYTRIYAMHTAIQFRDVPQRWHNARSIETATAFHIDDGRQQQLRDLFEASFKESLASVRAFETSNEVGRNVLLVQGILTDVISGVPPYLPGSTVTNIRWPWEANLVLEVRDSMTYTVLARTVERQRIDGPIDASLVSAMTPRIVHDWTHTLLTRLEDLRGLYPSRLSRRDEQREE